MLNMSRKEALKVQKEAQGLQLEQLRNFYETIPKDQRPEEIKYLKPMLDDKLFMRTGVEHEHLDIIWANLQMDNDPEWKDMQRDFDQAVKLIQKDGQERSR